MSEQARQDLVDSRNVVFERDSQRLDLLSTNTTETGLIALLIELTGKGHIIEFTAICSDHRDDSGLGLHCHSYGYAADLWPLNSDQPGDWMSASNPRFAQFLRDAAASQYIYQIGLAGSAWTETNKVAAGDTCFEDDGADHIHLGATNP